MQRPRCLNPPSPLFFTHMTHSQTLLIGFPTQPHPRLDPAMPLTIPEAQALVFQAGDDFARLDPLAARHESLDDSFDIDRDAQGTGIDRDTLDQVVMDTLMKSILHIRDVLDIPSFGAGYQLSIRRVLPAETLAGRCEVVLDLVLGADTTRTPRYTMRSQIEEGLANFPRIWSLYDQNRVRWVQYQYKIYQYSERELSVTSTYEFILFGDEVDRMRHVYIPGRYMREFDWVVYEADALGAPLHHDSSTYVAR